MQITLPLFVAAATAFIPFQHAPTADEAHAAAQAAHAEAARAYLTTQHAELIQEQEQAILARAQELAAAAQAARRDAEMLREFFDASTVAQSAKREAELAGKLKLNQVDVARVQREVAEQAAQTVRAVRSGRRQDVDLEGMDVEQLLELQKRVNEQLHRRGEHHTGKTTYWNATPAPRGQASAGAVAVAPRTNYARPSWNSSVAISGSEGGTRRAVKIDGEVIELGDRAEVSTQDGRVVVRSGEGIALHPSRSPQRSKVSSEDGKSTVEVVRTAPARREAEVRRRLATELKMKDLEQDFPDIEVVDLFAGTQASGGGSSVYRPARPARPASPAPPAQAFPQGEPGARGGWVDTSGFFSPRAARVQGAPAADLDEVTDLVRDMVHEIRDLRAAVEELRARVQAQSF